MNPCETLAAELWDWLEAPDTHPQNQEIQQHLQSCSSCQAQLAEIKALRGTLSQLSDRPSAEFDANLNRALEAERAGEEFQLHRLPQKSFWKRPLSLVALGAAAVLLVGLFSRQDLPEKELPGLNLNGSAPVAQSEGLIERHEWSEADSAKAGQDSVPQQDQDVIPVSTAP
jgi:anti-sigma factor RsiW